MVHGGRRGEYARRWVCVCARARACVWGGSSRAGQEVCVMVGAVVVAVVVVVVVVVVMVKGGEHARGVCSLRDAPHENIEHEAEHHEFRLPTSFGAERQAACAEVGLDSLARGAHRRSPW